MVVPFKYFISPSLLSNPGIKNNLKWKRPMGIRRNGNEAKWELGDEKITSKAKWE
jgi:hypothetical protein